MPKEKSKIKEVKVNNFWSGVVNNPRSTLASGFYYGENVNIKGKHIKQVVNNQDENACGYDVDNYVTKIVQVGSTLYALGQDNNVDNDTTIWVKAKNLTDVWGTMTNTTIRGTTYRGGDSLLACINNVLFIDGGTDYIGKYTIDTDTMDADWASLSGGLKGGEVWQGRIYGWDTSNYIYAIDPVADTLTQKILIPAEQTPVQIVPYGNLLMIICTSTVTNSKAYLWDGISTTAFIDILDLGKGTVSGGDILDGIVYAVIGSPNKRNLKIKAYNGGIFQTVFSYSARPDREGTYAYIQPASRVKAFSGYVYFIITGTKPDGTYANYYEYAIARFGRDEPINPMTFSIYKTLDFSSARVLDGQTDNNDFTILENIVGTEEQDEKSIVAFINSDTKKTTEFIGSNNDFTEEAGVVETFKINGADGSQEKKLMGVAGYYTALSETGQVVMKYKIDGGTGWVEIFTDTTDGALSYQAVNLVGTWGALPTFKEIQLRFEMLGGVTLTGWKMKYEELTVKNY
jgi:hypothetical protein